MSLAGIGLVGTVALDLIVKALFSGACGLTDQAQPALCDPQPGFLVYWLGARSAIFCAWAAFFRNSSSRSMPDNAEPQIWFASQNRPLWISKPGTKGQMGAVGLTSEEVSPATLLVLGLTRCALVQAGHCTGWNASSSASSAVHPWTCCPVNGHA